MIFKVHTTGLLALPLTLILLLLHTAPFTHAKVARIDPHPSDLHPLPQSPALHTKFKPTKRQPPLPGIEIIQENLFRGYKAWCPDHDQFLSHPARNRLVRNGFPRLMLNENGPGQLQYNHFVNEGCMVYCHCVDTDTYVPDTPLGQSRIKCREFPDMFNDFMGGLRMGPLIRHCPDLCQCVEDMREPRERKPIKWRGSDPSKWKNWAPENWDGVPEFRGPRQFGGRWGGTDEEDWELAGEEEEWALAPDTSEPFMLMGKMESDVRLGGSYDGVGLWGLSLPVVHGKSSW